MKIDTSQPVSDYRGDTIPANEQVSRLFGLRMVLLGDDGKPLTEGDQKPLTLGDLLWEAMQVPDAQQQQQGTQMSVEEKRFCHRMSFQALSGSTIEIDKTEKEKIVERAGRVLPTAPFGLLDDALSKAEVDAEIAEREKSGGTVGEEGPPADED